ncbi:MAG: hypothetical protein HY927_11410 [Elusimicrobia bacterium]|nr:hypothetical protein [Elusimicrobiota bacterium]
MELSKLGRTLSLLGCALALGLVAGCATSSKPVEPKSTAPEWVGKGSGAFKDGGALVFYGVGIHQGSRNRAISEYGSNDRGRGELAKIMNSYVTVLTKDYMASTTAGDMKNSSEEQHTAQTLKVFAKQTLNFSQAVDHWRDPVDSTYFALVKLDMSGVKKALEECKELDTKVRDFVRANAEKAFDELQAEEAKH